MGEVASAVVGCAEEVVARAAVKPVTAAAQDHGPPSISSFAPPPEMRSFPPSPQMTSRTTVPARTSLAGVPEIG